jgi:3-hydroxyacyl-CoA dehydrogenase / enoyl-CoA hydratase / 3-hydroxybutyryl-CoA epimerase
MDNWNISRDADGLAWLTFDKAGATINTLSATTLAEFNDALDILDRDPPKGLVIRSGKANGFIAGADVEEFGHVRGDADALAIVKRGWDTFERLARVAYPTLALVRGFCLGGGLELALACRYRVAVDEAGTRLGLPEVMLGIVPGWGGIKRLPRLAGAPAALDLLLTGRTIDARRARKLGIVDECVPSRIMDATARGVLRALPPPRSLGFPLSLTLNPIVRRVIAAQAAKKVAQRARREHYPAPYAVLDLWVKCDGDALALPASDPASIPALFRSPTTANLLRVFKLQERLKGLGKEGDFRAAHVHVVGAGTMGGDIAAWCAVRGLRVTLQDQSAERLAPAMARAGKLFAQRLRDARRVRDATDRLIPDVAGDGVARADVIIEAIFENVDAKRALFTELERRARPDAILASNTSSIPLENIGTAMSDPSRLIGLHFFNPVAKMMLVEIVVGQKTQEMLVPRAAAFVRQIDKLPLPVKSAPGFLVNRLLAPYLMAAMRCVDEGIAAETVDEAALGFGMPMGPIELADTVGLDICVAVGKLLGDGVAAPAKLQALIDAGHLGRKTGRGFYAWVDGKPRKAAAGPVPEGLADRLVGPFVNEAKAALAQRIVADADLVDAGAIFGTGFAPFRGGPLHYGAAL